MSPIALTDTERDAAIAEALKRKEEFNRGTSVDTKITDKTDVLNLSPELERALSTGLEATLTKIFDKEVQARATKHGESFSQARTVVTDAVDALRLKREREQRENEFIAQYFSGVYYRNKDTMKKAIEDETKFLGRDTGLMKKFEERAMGGANAGDELVPEIFASRVIENIERHGVTRKHATMIPMTTDTVRFPTVTAGLTAYEVAAGAAITASDLTTGQLTLQTRKLATITALHNELLANANPSIVPLLVDFAGRALANKEDTLALTGSGSTVTGILESSTNALYLGGSSTSGQTTIASVDFDDLAAALDALDSQYVSESCKFFFHKKVIYYLQLLKNSADYYWKPASASNPGTIHGFQYVTSSVMPSAPAANTAFGFFGDMRGLYMGDRNLFEVSIGREGTVGSDNLFEKDMSAVRVIEHVEFEIADAEYFAPIKTSTT